MSSPARSVALYHRVEKHEDFYVAAKRIFDLIKSSQQNHMNISRILYLDIDGHRNALGDFDPDMYELQKDYLLGFLLPYLTEVTMPLMRVKNPRPQLNDLPDTILFPSYKEPETEAAATKSER